MADRKPDETGEQHQQHDADEGVEGQHEDMRDLAPIQFGSDIRNGEPSGPCGHGDDDEDPDGVEEPRRLL